jgi:CheY-like chemotaxis protein
MTEQLQTVLIIDDDDDIRETIVESLSEEGFAVVGAASGGAALALLASAGPKPALILLDLMMPVMTGAEFRARQLGDPALAAIPVVILTADPAAEARAVELKTTGWLRKPLKLQTLIDVVASFASRR